MSSDWQQIDVPEKDMVNATKYQQLALHCLTCLPIFPSLFAHLPISAPCDLCWVPKYHTDGQSEFQGQDITKWLECCLQWLLRRHQYKAQNLVGLVNYAPSYLISVKDDISDLKLSINN